MSNSNLQEGNFGKFKFDTNWNLKIFEVLKKNHLRYARSDSGGGVAKLFASCKTIP